MLFGNRQRSKTAAEEAIRDGDLDKAIGVLVKITKKSPDDIQAHKRLADLYQTLDRKKEAIAHYEIVATQYSEQGLLLRAIAACRSILELDPENAAATRTLDTLDKKRTQTDAYAEAKRDGRATILEDDDDEAVISATDLVDDALADDGHDAFERLTEEIDPDLVLSERNASELPLPVNDSIIVASDDVTAPPTHVTSEVDLDELLDDDDDALIVGETDLAHHYAPSTDAMSVPALFSGIPSDAFYDLVRGLQMWEVPGGAHIIRQGEFGTSCFLIASGSVRVERDRQDDAPPDVLGQLSEGDVFGEIALLARNQRTANVIATEPTEVLEIEREFLEALIAKYPRVQDALTKFSRDRMLQNLMRTAPLFRDLSRRERTEALARFAPKDARMGETLLVEGQPATGLYVILTGEVEVSKSTPDGGVETVRSLQEGDVFGEMSLFFSEPAVATITVLRNAHLMWLAPDDFAQFCRRSPALTKRLKALGQSRARLNAETFETQRRRGADFI